MADPFDVTQDDPFEATQSQEPDQPKPSLLAGQEAVVILGETIAREIVAGLGGSAVALFNGNDAGVEFGEAVRDRQTEPSAGAARVLEGVGKGGEAVVRGARKPVAGLAGIIKGLAVARTPQGTGKGVATATETIEGITEEGVGATLGDALLEATGSPFLATIGRVLPEATVELAGLKGAGRAVKAAETTSDVSRGTRPVARIEGEQVSVGAPRLDEAVDVTPPTVVQEAQTLAPDVRRARTESVAEQVRPDPAIVQAAEELNIELPASATSTNRAFQELEQAIKSQPGSRLGAKEAAAIDALDDRATTLIRDLGGQTDKSLLDDALRSEFNDTITKLDDKAGVAYEVVDETIPPTHRITLGETENGLLSYIDNTLEELGGDTSLLSTAEKKMLRLARDADGNARTPTYAALDRLRKDVGQGFNRLGPYKDDAHGTLKRVYAALSEEQQAVANSFEIGGDYARARKLVNQRKIIEDQSLVLFGRDLSTSLVPKIRNAATKLTKGDVSQFKKIMEAIPDGRRAEAAATLLHDIFTSGARTNQRLGAGFANAFDGLNRNVAAKRLLFSYLEPGAQARFDKIGKVATGLFRAKALENNSRTARAILQTLEDGGMMDRVYSIGKKAAVMETVGAASGVPGLGTTIALATKGKITPAITAADQFLTSPVFARSVRLAGSGKAQIAEEIVTKSPKYQKWLKFADERTAGQIARVGFISWLIGEGER